MTYAPEYEKELREDLSDAEWVCLKRYVLLASVGFREVGTYEKHVRLDASGGPS